MGLRNTTTEWGSLAKALHWLIAIGLVALVALGLVDVKPIHKSIAMLVFVLMTVRLIWRFMNEVPAHPDGMSGAQRALAALVHWGLYLVVFVQLFAGVMVSGTGGKPWGFFGLFSVPLPVAEDDEAHHFWEEVHEFVWIVLAVLVALHVLGALYNHFALKNDVLRRMTTGVNRT